MKQKMLLVVALIASNFIYAFIHALNDTPGNHFQIAIERSYFQTVALLLAMSIWE